MEARMSSFPAANAGACGKAVPACEEVEMLSPATPLLKLGFGHSTSLAVRPAATPEDAGRGTCVGTSSKSAHANERKKVTV